METFYGFTVAEDVLESFYERHNATQLAIAISWYDTTGTAYAGTLDGQYWYAMSDGDFWWDAKQIVMFKNETVRMVK